MLNHSLMNTDIIPETLAKTLIKNVERLAEFAKIEKRFLYCEEN